MGVFASTISLNMSLAAALISLFSFADIDRGFFTLDNDGDGCFVSDGDGDGDGCFAPDVDGDGCFVPDGFFILEQ